MIKDGVSRAVTGLCVALVIAFPLVQAFRGVDLTDTGFLLTNQAWVFRDPQAVSYWFHLWLPNFLGGVVLAAAGPVGLFASKLAAALLFWGLVWAVLRLYGGEVPRHWLLVGLAAGMGFDFINKINIVHYNNLSVLFFGWAAYFLVEGTVQRRVGPFLFAGVFLGLNLFVRLPNLLGLGLILVPVLLGHRLRWRDFGAYVVGGVVAVGSVVLVMLLAGHLRPYLDSVKALVGAGGDPDSQYGVADLLRRPLRETFWALVAGAATLVLLGVLGWVVDRVRSRLPVSPVFAQMVLAASLGVVFLALAPDYRAAALLVAGVGYWVAVFLLFRGRYLPARARMALVLGAVVVFLLSWGSDTRIAVSTYAFPMVLAGLPILGLAGARAPTGTDSSVNRAVVVGLGLFLGAVMVYGTVKMGATVYRDSAWGSTALSLEGVGPVLTTSQRARALETMVGRVTNLTQPGDEVLMVDSLPLVHYLTKTRPYLRNPWPALYTPTEFRSILNERAEEALPSLVVIAKANARAAGWPENRGGSRIHETEVREFLKAKGFVLVANDDDAWYFSLR